MNNKFLQIKRLVILIVVILLTILMAKIQLVLQIPPPHEITPGQLTATWITEQNIIIGNYIHLTQTASPH